MRVAVTGATGRLGRRVVELLIDRGVHVVAMDRVRPARVHPLVEWHEIDLSDPAAALEASSSASALIHTAAIPSPGGHPEEVIFFNNVSVTYSTVRAAQASGINRLVLVGSVAALGGAWAPQRIPPDYAPVDEDHPLRPRDAYGLTKLIDEHLGAWLARRRPSASITLLRMHWILEPEELAGAAADVALEPASMAHLLWGYVDVRDAARACVQALHRAEPGYACANVTAADTLATEPTADLIHRHALQTVLRQPIDGCATAWRLDAARQLFGYTPQHSWRDTEDR